MKSVSFLVLNWNGEDVISRCLDASSRALENYKGPGEILVVDNGSSDGSVSIIERDYPRVRLVKLRENLGFSEGNNVGVRESRGDIVILVNNDAYVHPDFLIPIVPHFDDDQVFGVTPKVFGLDGRTITIAKTEAYFYRGLIRLKFTEDIYSSPLPCLWATGGSGAFDRQKYLELGGLLELLYWEDLELGYRAWKKRGWKTIYEPRSLVYHNHGTSFNKIFRYRQLKNVRERNRFLFQWMSITDPLLIIRHLFFLPYILGYSGFKGKWSYIVGFLQALRSYREFKRKTKNLISAGGDRLNDREVLRITSSQ